MTKRTKPKRKKPWTADTRKGRVILPEWIHVREDMWQEMIDVLDCVRANLDGDEENDWLSVEAGKLLKEIGQ